MHMVGSIHLFSVRMQRSRTVAFPRERVARSNASADADLTPSKQWFNSTEPVLSLWVSQSILTHQSQLANQNKKPWSDWQGSGGGGLVEKSGVTVLLS